MAVDDTRCLTAALQPHAAPARPPRCPALPCPALPHRPPKPAQARPPPLLLLLLLHLLPPLPAAPGQHRPTSCFSGPQDTPALFPGRLPLPAARAPHRAPPAPRHSPRPSRLPQLGRRHGRRRGLEGWPSRPGFQGAPHTAAPCPPTAGHDAGSPGSWHTPACPPARPHPRGPRHPAPAGPARGDLGAPGTLPAPHPTPLPPPPLPPQPPSLPPSKQASKQAISHAGHHHGSGPGTGVAAPRRTAHSSARGHPHPPTDAHTHAQASTQGPHSLASTQAAGTHSVLHHPQPSRHRRDFGPQGRFAHATVGRLGIPYTQGTPRGGTAAGVCGGGVSAGAGGGCPAEGCRPGGWVGWWVRGSLGWALAGGVQARFSPGLAQDH